MNTRFDGDTRGAGVSAVLFFLALGDLAPAALRFDFMNVLARHKRSALLCAASIRPEVFRQSIAFDIASPEADSGFGGPRLRQSAPVILDREFDARAGFLKMQDNLVGLGMLESIVDRFLRDAKKMRGRGGIIHLHRPVAFEFAIHAGGAGQLHQVIERSH
jgi:hypothetical protein